MLMLGLILATTVCNAQIAMTDSTNEIGSAVTVLDTVWGWIRPGIVAVGVFFVGYAFFKRFRRA